MLLLQYESYLDLTNLRQTETTILGSGTFIHLMNREDSEQDAQCVSGEFIIDSCNSVGIQLREQSQ